MDACRKTLADTTSDPRYLKQIQALYAAPVDVEFVNDSKWNVDTSKLLKETTLKVALLGFGDPVFVNRDGQIAMSNRPDASYESPASWAYRGPGCNMLWRESTVGFLCYRPRE